MSTGAVINLGSLSSDGRVDFVWTGKFFGVEQADQRENTYEDGSGLETTLPGQVLLDAAPMFGRFDLGHGCGGHTG